MSYFQTVLHLTWHQQSPSQTTDGLHLHAGHKSEHWFWCTTQWVL